MIFEEALARARAAHVQVDTFNQPGNDYRTEHRCKCDAFVFATNWEQHVLEAADAFLEAAPSHGVTLTEEAVEQVADAIEHAAALRAYNAELGATEWQAFLTAKELHALALLRGEEPS